MSDADGIEARAAEWLLRQDAGGAKGHDAFATWLAADPRHRAAYLRLASGWERTAQLNRLRPDSGVIDPDLLGRGTGSSRSGSRRPLAFAAAAVAGVLTIWGFLYSSGSQIYSTEVGGFSRILLTDGSTVTLNTNTEVRVQFSPKLRSIKLLRGEAQFAVAHNTSRPFEVSAGGRIVRAVGTAFDVRLDADQAVQVMVMEGRVAVEDLSTGRSTEREQSGAAMVSAGESAVAAAGRLTVRHVSDADVSRQLAWRTGELSFQGETLREAVAEFNRYNPRKLRVDDPAIAHLRVGGNFQALDTDSFVSAVERSFNLATRTAEDGSLIFERAKVSGP